MQRISPVVSGKAWEYELACQFRSVLGQGVNLRHTPARVKAEAYFKRLDFKEQHRIRKAAGEVAVFLKYHDLRTHTVQSIEIQSDQRGEIGDVRDILIHTPNNPIGVSAKHRHTAIKHSRLSQGLDFGQAWYGVPCSERYWEAVAEIFRDLEAKKGGLWRELQNKEQWYYKPILDAFMDEI